jgi:chromosome transmission fidelity protein 1
LICGALTWLRDHKRWVLEHGDDENTKTGLVLTLVTVGNEPEWVLEYERHERRIATEVRKKEMEERIARIRERERREKLAARKMNGKVIKRRVTHFGVWLIQERRTDRR